MSELPWMGLGLSSNLGPADRPDPWHLHRTQPGLFDFVEYSAPLSLEEAMAEAAGFRNLLERREELPAVFHPVHLNLWGPELESKTRIQSLREHLAAVGSPWVGNDVGWWHHRGTPIPGYLYLPPPFDEAALDGCVAHALHVQNGIDVPLLLENPAVMQRNGALHVLDFMAALHQRTGLPLLLDLGHLLAYQLTSNLPWETGLDGFPLDQVVEIHIAGGVITRRGGRRFYVDDHTQPVREELFEMLERILPRCTGLKAVTFEADGHPEPIAVRTLERLRRLVPSTREGDRLERPSVVASPFEGAANVQETLESMAWKVWEMAYAGAPGDDPEGQEADVDFRLAVLAQILDRDWPLSRLILAGSREGLAEFAASPEFRSLFEVESRTPGQVFFTWARRKLREAPIAGGDAVVAFEAWAHGQLGQRSRPSAEEGTLSLAPGVAAATFPLDLSELVFAAAAVRRHLSDRAWASGLLEASGLDGLLQVASRAAPGPWPVLISRGHRLEVEPLDPKMLPVLQAAARGLPAESVPPDRLARAEARGWVLRR